MAVFLLTDDDVKRVQAAAAEARHNPVTLDMLKSFAVRVRVGTPEVQERVPGDRPRSVPKPQIVELPLGWRLNLSCELQPDPVGRCLHLSLSSPTPHKSLARREAVELVLGVLGLGDAAIVTQWIEPYFEEGKGAGKAVNVIVVDPVLPPWDTYRRAYSAD